MTLIEFKNIYKAHGDKILFENLSFKIEKGDFVTLTGTSGDGKTTLLRMINGMEKPDQGEIHINYQSIEKQDILHLRRNIGYAIQGSGLFPHMSVEDNILYVPSLSKKWTIAEQQSRLLTLLDIVSLDDSLLKRYPDELSGGQQQRVGIARALAAEPEILLMDEPFGALDSFTRTQLQDSIKQIHSKLGITIIFVTHDELEAQKLATRQLLLKQGEIWIN
ncbi:ABC transporter ATP-binding protein [Thorsellia anophelis]|uniref:Osmoprotectant transport system ATP-binding protein n=1 Tax=Thorsellia anophelis DSM 18579 TaxID=1123402 RepID=A0A1I0CTP5_9GAMM|nr:ABC transporter ATP-binding protein [Thorsellia anophelis]SET22753.1 osmoprotectant transport system ATP-binding protein [Thorsellia anophelis DSM 18579]